MGSLEAVSSLPLRRDTVHEVLDGRVFGVPFFNKVIPIQITIKNPGETLVKAVISYDKVTQVNLPYEDLGEMEKCCKKVYTFNIRHYLKCYLTGDTDGPYTFNLCQKCGVGITDDRGHTMQQTTKRSYRRDRYIYESSKVLQDESGNKDLFNYENRVLSDEC